MIHVCLLMLLAAPTDKAKPIETTIAELREASQGFNDAFMDEKFTDKRVQLSGQVRGIIRYQNLNQQVDKYLVSLTPVISDNEREKLTINGVVADDSIETYFLPEERSVLAKLKRSQVVVITGIVEPRKQRDGNHSYFGSQFILRECKIVEAKPMQKPEPKFEERKEKVRR